MKNLNHLLIEEIKVPPGEEWMDTSKTWRFVLLHSGAAYWLSANETHPLAEGEMLLLPPKTNGTVRASQLGEVVLYGFAFAPESLWGFFSQALRHFFEGSQAGKSAKAWFFPGTHAFAQRFAAVVAQRSELRALSQRAEALAIASAVLDEQIVILPPVSRGTTALHRFEQFITKTPDTEIIKYTPRELADLCNCSPRHFNRLFQSHFGTSARARQTELRLLKSRELLRDVGIKVIHVALECGYQNLSLFNSLFKRRFHMTPSEWRKRVTGKNKNRHFLAASLLVLLSGVFGLRAVEVPAFSDVPTVTRGNEETATRLREAMRMKLVEIGLAERGITNVAKALEGTNGVQTFQVRGYELLGNTLLPSAVVDSVLWKHTGPAMTLSGIREALADVQMAYRERGFITVSVALPQQQLTNGIVKFQVTEGRLADITIRGNKYFSSNNIVRALPSLRTNTILNSLVFGQELDRANANRDRQIYPVISPGPEPGTSALELKVKERLPFHTRIQLNNYSTPDTPEMRLNLSAVYGNLWQREHQIGGQYSLTPEALKDGDYVFYDKPLIASYSMFYRMPLSPVNGLPRDYSLNDFGYDEVTHRFRAPPATASSELLFYASRSFSDSGTQLDSSTLTPEVIPPEGTLQVSDKIFKRTLNPNENLGARFSKPLPDAGPIRSTFSFGLDWKNYRSTLIQSRVFQATLFVPEIGQTGPPFTEFHSPPTASSRTIFTSVQYLPFSLNFDASTADKYGSTAFNLNQSFNFSGWLNDERDFREVAGSREADGNYYVVTAGATREQKIVRDWAIRFHADGQWANQPLISNERFGLGGLAGVRGYRDGEEYGDTGWRATIEPHSPYLDLGLVDNSVPFLARLYTFVDCGQRFLLDPGPQKRSVTLLGTGFGIDAAIGEHFDFRLVVGVPLLKTQNREAFDPRVSFSIAAQF